MTHEPLISQELLPIPVGVKVSVSRLCEGARELLAGRDREARSPSVRRVKRIK